MLVIRAATEKLRILCCREYQNSIDESAKHLLEKQIEYLELEDEFRSTRKSIVSSTGSEFIFEGLHANLPSIKSLEGIDICWVEEAQTIVKGSWDVLTPTIRAPNSEIWITFNPELEIDETYQRFIVNPPSGAIVIEMNYSDNPWFPDVLEQERLDCLARDPVGYRHVWEGECRQAVEGAIYGDLLARAKEEGRITSVPMDLALPVHTAWDLGVLNPTAIWFFQVTPGGEIHYIDYYEDSPAQQSGVDESGLPFHARMIHAKPYTYGTHYAPHDIEAREMGTGKSRVETALALGIRFTTVPRIAPKDSREDEAGIAVVRDAFPRMWFDREKTKLGVQMLSRYRRGFNRTLREFMATPVHDAASHCFTGDTEVLTIYGACRIMDLPKSGQVLTPCGWNPYRNPRITRRNARLVAVTFDGGLTVKCTPDHMFLTALGWRSAGNLTSHSLIQSSLTPSRSILMGTYTALSLVARPIREVQIKVIDLEQVGCIERFGRALSVLFLKAVNRVLTVVSRLWRLFARPIPVQDVWIAVKHVKHLPIVQDVWCLTVPESEVFSLVNGAVVHNCADAIRTGNVGYKSPEIVKQRELEDRQVYRGDMGWAS